MNPTAIPLGALPPSAATQPLQAVRGPWVPGELLLRRAVRTVNEDLAIVGLRLVLGISEVVSSLRGALQLLEPRRVPLVRGLRRHEHAL